MELYRIPIKDIRPDANNPRKDFGDIEALAESFRLNPVDKGEPLQPIVTVRDGNVFRIVDGERRYRAMKHLGAIECWSNVCDDFAEADAVVQMLATNDKLALDDHEKSLGVQTMLLLGVDEQVVERAAHVKGAKRIRRAMDVAGRAQEMTLDHLLAIAEAEEAGDDEAVSALSAADDRSWEAKAARFRRAREARAELDRILADAREIGFDILDAEPKRGELGEYEWLGRAEREELQEVFDQGFTHLFAEAHDWGATAEVYMDAGCQQEDEDDAEERARREMVAEFERKYDAGDADARAWVGTQLASGNVPKPLADWFEDKFPETMAGMHIMSFCDKAGVELLRDGEHPVHLVAYALECEWPTCRYSMNAIAVGEKVEGWQVPRVREWIEFHDMLMDSGWPAPDYFASIACDIEDAIEACESTTGDGGQEDDGSEDL